LYKNSDTQFAYNCEIKWDVSGNPEEKYFVLALSLLMHSNNDTVGNIIELMNLLWGEYE